MNLHTTGVFLQMVHDSSGNLDNIHKKTNLNELILNE